MALTVAITGTTDIQQGGNTTLTATVTDSDGNAVQDATVDFTASQGSLSVASGMTNASGELDTVYTADFTDSSDVDVTITANATLPTNPNPTVTSATLTSLSELGIDNIVANLLVTSTGDIDPNNSAAQNIYQMGVVGTVDPNSDPDINSELAINRVRWSPQGRQIILNRSGTQDWATWDDTHGELSLFVVTQSGVVQEFPVDETNAAGGGFINWTLEDIPENSAFLSAMGAIDTGDTLLVGFGDSDSIGFPADMGTGTETVTARAIPVTPVATSLEIVSGNNQSAEISNQLTNPLVVRVLDQLGNPFENAEIDWDISPTATLNHGRSHTGVNGQTSVEVTLGTTVGSYQVRARLMQTATFVMFSVTGTASVTVLSFGTATIVDQSWQVGDTVNITLPEATGGTSPLDYSLIGTRPAGIMFMTATRILRGTPSAVFANATFTYRVTDADNNTADLTFDIQVSAAPTMNATVRFASTFPTQHYQVGRMIAITLPEAESAAGIQSYELTPTIDFGLTFDDTTRVLSGTPDAVVHGLQFRYTATTTQNVSISQLFRIYVEADAYTIDNENFVSILPPNATQFEKNVEQMLRESFLPVDSSGHRHLASIDAWNPNKAPLDTLGYLGMNLSTAVDTTLSESAQRELLQEAFTIHSLEGTVGSLLRVIEAIGFPGAVISEGVDDENGVAHWANYSICINENLTITVGRALLALVRDLQPVRCHLIAIDVTTSNQLWDGSISFDGMHSFGSIIDSGLV